MELHLKPPDNNGEVQPLEEDAWREVWEKISDMDGDWTVEEPVDVTTEDN